MFLIEISHHSNFFNLPIIFSIKLFKIFIQFAVSVFIQTMNISVTFILFAVLVTAAVISAERSHEEQRFFKDWCKKHNKKYRSHDEEEAAMENMLTHKKTVDAHNQRYHDGEVSYKMHLPHHSDLTMDEIVEHLGGHLQNPDKESYRTARAAASTPTYTKGPDSIDWVAKGLVGPVEQQGQCGSCWAFSIAAVVNAYIRKKNKKATTLVSPQQLVDCDRGTYVLGCKGGNVPLALEYVKKKGMTSEEQYPYKDYQSKCEYSSAEKVVSVSKYYYVQTNGNETLMRDVVGSVGPVSIQIILEPSIYFYSEGMYEPESCDTDDYHAPVIVGYGTDPKQGDYWMVKNSWGKFRDNSHYK